VLSGYLLSRQASRRGVASGVPPDVEGERLAARIPPSNLSWVYRIAAAFPPDGTPRPLLFVFHPLGRRTRMQNHGINDFGFLCGCHDSRRAGSASWPRPPRASGTRSAACCLSAGDCNGRPAVFSRIDLYLSTVASRLRKWALAMPFAPRPLLGWLPAFEFANLVA
jgi:hypothetical protein